MTTMSMRWLLFTVLVVFTYVAKTDAAISARLSMNETPVQLHPQNETAANSSVWHSVESTSTINETVGAMKGENFAANKSTPLTAAQTNLGTGQRTNSTTIDGVHASFKRSNAGIITTPLLPPGARIAALVEKFSAALEEVGIHLKKTMRRAYRTDLKIMMHNCSHAIATVAEKRLYVSSESSEKVRPVRVVLSRGWLQVDVDEAMQSSDAKRTVHYEMPMGHENARVDDIYLLARGERGYDIVIPLVQERKSVEIVSRSQEEGRNSEDEYEFLKEQLACREKFGNKGVERLICTCNRAYAGQLEARFRCLWQVVDRAEVAAKGAGEVQVGRKLKEKCLGCRNVKLGRQGSYDCVVDVLKSMAGLGSGLIEKHGRIILALDMNAVEENDERVSGVAKTIYLGYMVAIVLLVVCMQDVYAKYQEYKRQSKRTSDFGRMPGRARERAQSLYSRLVALIV